MSVVLVGSHKSRVERENHLPQPAGHSAFDAAQDTVGFWGCKWTFLTHVELLFNQHPQVLFVRATLNLFFPACVCAWDCPDHYVGNRLVCLTQLQPPATGLSFSINRRVTRSVRAPQALGEDSSSLVVATFHPLAILAPLPSVSAVREFWVVWLWAVGALQTAGSSLPTPHQPPCCYAAFSLPPAARPPAAGSPPTGCTFVRQFCCLSLPQGKGLGTSSSLRSAQQPHSSAALSGWRHQPPLGQMVLVAQLELQPLPGDEWLPFCLEDQRGACPQAVQAWVWGAGVPGASHHFLDGPPSLGALPAPPGPMAAPTTEPARPAPFPHIVGHAPGHWHS